MGKLKIVLKYLVYAFLLSFVLDIGGLFSGIYAERSGLPEEWLENSQGATVFMLICQITLPIFLMFQYKGRKNDLRIVMPFAKDKKANKYLIGYAAGAIFFLLTWIIAVAFGGFQVVNIWHMRNVLWLVLFLLGFCIQGMGEEILVRGYLLGKLSQHLSYVSAIIISSIFFAALHLANPGITRVAFLELFLFGAIMAMIRIETNDLWTVGAFHGAWNFFQGPILGVAVSGTNGGVLIFKSIPTQAYEWLNGGRFGIEGSAMSLTLHVVLFGVTAVWIKLNKNNSKIICESTK
ncbi:CPBP family intramembrane glutamic endopeptidase [Leuconostoc sp. JNUCC 76]